MKLLHPTFNQLFRFLQICNSVACSWPYNPDVSKFVFIFREIYYRVSLINIIVLLMTLIYAFYGYWHDIATTMKILMEFAGVMQLLVNIVTCRLKNARIQHVLTEMKNFHLTCNDHERIILQKYIDRYVFSSTIIIICYFLAVIISCCNPMFTSKKLPSVGLYPFPIESSLVLFIIYVIQVCTYVQCGFCIGMDFMFAAFFLYSAARLEMLCSEIEAAKNERHINSCIKKHQEIIKFVYKTKDIVKFSLFMTNITMAVGAICATLFIYEQSRTFLFIFIVISACQRLYITASPADDLMENSERVAMAAYNMSWIGKSQSLIQNIQIIMRRSQKPLVINMGSLLPTLSLKYYAKYLMTIFTYLMTIRAIIDNLNH